MRAILVLMLVAAAAPAQSVIAPDRLPERWRTMERLPSEEKLQCRVRPIRPNLNLGFRFQTGYNIEVPMRQYKGKGHWWAAILRITPKSSEREPVWLVAKLGIPAVPDTKAVGEFSGSYLIGEGEYQVDLMLVDDANRVCVADWKVSAKLNNTVRNVRPGMPPGTVDDISLRRVGRLKHTLRAEERMHNVSILVHAAAALPGRMRMRGYDRMLLMSAVTSMVERLPLKNVRLTIFSMDKQQVVYHTADLTRGSFNEALDALSRLELGTVDYSTLTNRDGHLRLLTELLDKETAADPDALIFVGPVARWTEKLPPESPLPQIPSYYIQLRPFRMAQALQTDTVSRTVRQLGGKTKEVYSPEDFAEAIQALEQLLRSAPASKSN